MVKGQVKNAHCFNKDSADFSGLYPTQIVANLWLIFRVLKKLILTGVFFFFVNVFRDPYILPEVPLSSCHLRSGEVESKSCLNSVKLSQ